MISPTSPEPIANNYEGSLSSQIQKLFNLCHENKKNLFLKDVHLSIGMHGHAILCLIFSIPFLFPIPLPGLSMIFGFVIMTSSASMAFSKKPWLPQILLKQKISTKTVLKILQVALKTSRFMERFVRIRGLTLQKKIPVNVISGILIFLSAFLLSLPLPPGTNFPPATTIFLLSVGQMEKDLLFSFLGILAFIFNITIFIYLYLYGVKGFQWIWTQMSGN
ncbi:MAG: exopolysaccharide biosynthesis protein [Bdellovibrionales bacterium]|nr:exopolysaccharide biosynthesis protein [Bdellovibrionales bacterium]